MLGFYNYTVILTYLSLCSAVTGIFVGVSGTGHPFIATTCLMVCGFLDAFDGIVARSKKDRTEQEKKFGIQIDSLVDLVAFGVLPCAIGYSCYTSHYLNSFRLSDKWHFMKPLANCKITIFFIVFALFVLAALIRLAYFNVMEEERQNKTDEKRKYYTFNKYVREGGMSGSYLYKEEEQKYKYILDLYNTLIVRDIREKYKIKNTELLGNLTNFMMDNISNITSIRNITNSLNKIDNKLNHKTIGTYIDYMVNAYLFYKIKRYDIQGKKYLESQDKYYLVDPTFKFAKLGTKNMNYGRVYENIVAIELLRRGYEVYVGQMYNSEIDFVAMKRNEKIYIQVSDNISDDKALEREVNSLLKIKDAYPKILIARTRHDTYQYEGVQVYDIAKWLLE